MCGNDDLCDNDDEGCDDAAAADDDDDDDDDADDAVFLSALSAVRLLSPIRFTWPLGTVRVLRSACGKYKDQYKRPSDVTCFAKSGTPFGGVSLIRIILYWGR